MNQKPTFEKGRTFGKIALKKFRGKGTFGEVWDGWHHGPLPREVVIKIGIHRDSLWTFEKEYHLFLHIQKHSPKKFKKMVPQIIETSFNSSPPYLVFEKNDGRTLREILLETSDQLASYSHSPEEKREAFFKKSNLFSRFLTTLQRIHSIGVIHGDLKPENIFVLPSGAVLLFDFGAFDSGDELMNTLTEKEHKILGSLDYMAPEQKNTSFLCDQKSDIYSAGLIFFEMVVGRLPQGVEGPGDALDFLADSERNFLNSLYGKMVNHRKHRYNSAGKARHELSKFKHLSEILEEPPIPEAVEEEPSEEETSPPEKPKDLDDLFIYSPLIPGTVLGLLPLWAIYPFVIFSWIYLFPPASNSLIERWGGGYTSWTMGLFVCWWILNFLVILGCFEVGGEKKDKPMDSMDQFCGLLVSEVHLILSPMFMFYLPLQQGMYNFALIKFLIGWFCCMLIFVLLYPMLGRFFLERKARHLLNKMIHRLDEQDCRRLFIDPEYFDEWKVIFHKPLARQKWRWKVLWDKVVKNQTLDLLYLEGTMVGGPGGHDPVALTIRSVDGEFDCWKIESMDSDTLV